MRARKAGTARLASAPSARSRRGLDWFTFFVANLQTGFGPFLSVYLTTQRWTQVDIGLILSVGSVAGLIGQVPGGFLVDWVRSKRRAAALAVVGIGSSALLIAALPMFAGILGAKLLQVASSAVLGPAIAAITLGLVGHRGISERLGRNARFAAIGNGIAAAVMGACGYFVSAQAVFWVTALLTFPTLLALAHISEAEVDPIRAGGGNARGGPDRDGSIARLLRKPALLVLMGSVMLFHVANAAMLPLVGSAMAMRSGQWATALVAACIVVPQVIVAAISPRVGLLAQSLGRRPVLLAAFAALIVRGLLLAWSSDPAMIVAVQMLDGISAAAIGIIVPLVLADITRGTGRFNLAQGIVGTGAGVGATLSTTAAGWLADRYGMGTAFLGLAALAACGFLVVLAALQETRPK